MNIHKVYLINIHCVAYLTICMSKGYKMTIIQTQKTLLDNCEIRRNDNCVVARLVGANYLY